MHSFIILYLVHFYLEFYLNTSCTYKSEECYSHLFINVFQFYKFFKDHCTWAVGLLLPFVGYFYPTLMLQITHKFYLQFHKLTLPTL